MHSPNVQFDPKADEVPRLAYRFRQASQVIALLVATLGLVVLGGWAFDAPTLKYIRPTFQSMKVNTALCFLFLGAGLWLAHDDKRPRSRRILGVAVAIIAGASLVEYAFHVSLGIDQLLFRDTRTSSLTAYPGRMAIATALCFLFLGLAVAFLGVRKAIVPQRALVGACFALSLVALCGYLYGVKSLYAIPPFSTMALHTAAGLFAACLAYFLSRSDEGIVSIAASDSNSGFLLRTLVPAIIGVPIVIGWLRHAGQRANLYDTPFGTALMVLGSIGCLTVLTMLVARSMYRWECESSNAEKTTRESEERFRLVADTAPALIWMSGTDKLCTYFNKPWLDFTGRSIDSELGNGWAEGVHSEDLQRCLDTYTQSFDRREKFRMEYRLRRHDGEYRWILDIGVPRFNADGSFAGYIGIGVDVTERKRAEEALEKSEEKFSKAFRQSPMVLTLTSIKDNRYIDVNETFERITGWRRDEVIGRTPFDIGFWVDPAERVELTKRLPTEGRLRDVETRFRMKDGSIRIGLASAEVFELNGEPCMLAVGEDITERKAAEEALRESEERFRLAATAGKMFAYEWDVATDKVVRSEEHIKVLGFGDPAKQLTRQQVLARVHPDDRALFVTSVDQLTPQYPTTQISYRVLRPDGSIVWLEKNARGFFDEQGKLLRVIGMMANITERKRAEEALRESEEQFRTLAEAIPQLCWMAHGEGHIFWYNHRWYTYTGTTPEQMEGWGWQSVHDPQALPLVLERWKKSIATGEPFDMVFPLKAADGIFHPFLTRITPVKDSKGSVVRWFGTNTDVTELRNAQEALSEMSRKLVQAMEQERARIARELHDDINQRLAMLGIELERLQDNPSEVRSRVQELRKQTTELSNDVQALSHDLHSSQLEYLGAVRGMKSWCKEFGERQGLQIEFKSPDAQISLPKEIGLCLFRVLQEALHNAAKHSGVRRIEVQLREDSGEIHLVVSDLGRGFDWETAMQGRGLGLASMQERVRLVNGTIEIQSKPMGGTTVHVRVPLSSESAPQRAAG